jgi:C-terminal processing protease CtpA/Prc
VILLALLVPIGLIPADDARFDPPLDGACLGLSGGFRDGRVEVQAVERSSAAARAGISPGDTILRLGGAAGFSGMDDFVHAARGLRSGEPVEVVVRREGGEVTLSLVPDPAIFLDYYQILTLLRQSRFLRSRDGFEGALAEIENTTPQALRAAARSSVAFEALNRAVGRLGVSHAAVIPPWSYRNLFAGEGASGGRGTGLLLEKVAGREDSFFICEVMDGSAGAAAGALDGDEVVAVNGVPPGASSRVCLAGYESSHPHYTIQVDPDETFRLEVRRTPDGAPIALSVTADRPLSGLTASRASERWFTVNGRRIAYLHLWNLLSGDLPPVLDHVTDAPADFAEGLIVDLRGRGGQVAVTERVVKRLKALHRPMALLIDRETRSAKEIVAFKLKGFPGAVLIGERTAGAVLPALIQKLAGETKVMLPADRPPERNGRPPDADERLMWGELEGKGVDPDLPVVRGGLFSAGSDPILAAGTRDLVSRLAPLPRRRRL